jgi:protein TonB
METKKTPAANLENKRRLLLLIGFILAFAIVWGAFNIKEEVKTIEVPKDNSSEPPTELISETPPTLEKMLPLPKFVMTNTLVITDNTSPLEEPIVESTEITEGELIDALPNFPVEKSADEADSIFEIVEENPLFPGGEKVLLRWLANKIKYPQIAIDNGSEGVVFVNFVVEASGKVSNVRVVRAGDPSLDSEAERVVKDMPLWQPGLQRGKPVRVRFTIPIHFKLQES